MKYCIIDNPKNSENSSSYTLHMLLNFVHFLNGNFTSR